MFVLSEKYLGRYLIQPTKPRMKSSSIWEAIAFQTIEQEMARKLQNKNIKKKKKTQA